MIELKRYTPAAAQEWDRCVSTARQQVFLFERAYMDYHAGRFHDHSMMAYKDGQLVAVLPAHEQSGEWVSHGGLTFGGLVSGSQVKLADTLGLFVALVEYARQCGFTRLVYKPVPHIFHSIPAEDDVYALSLVGAVLRSRSASLCIDLRSPFGTPSRRMGGVKTALSRGVTVKESDDLESFWTILIERLRTAHGAAPIHTLDEITLLRNRFHEQIRLYAAFQDERMIAGLLMYEYPRVARTQYIAANDSGRSVSAVDLIVYEMLTRFYHESRFAYVDLGTSVRPEDDTINAGLYVQKEKLGGRPILIDTYHLDIATANTQSLRTHLT